MSIPATLLSIALLLFLLGGATGWGQLVLHLLFRRARKRGGSEFPGSPVETWYLAAALGVGFVSWFSLVLGLARLHYPTTAWGLLGLGWLTAAAVWVRSRRERSAGHAEAVGQAEDHPLHQRLLNLSLLLLGLGSLTYMLLAHALVPAHEWDEIAYHLALAKIYVRAHGIVYVPSIVHSNWPMNTEMLFVHGLLLGSETVAHFVTWWMTVWTSLGLYLTGRRFFDRRIGLLAATLFLLIPLVTRLGGTGLIDISLAFYGAAAILAYAHYHQNRSVGWLALLGLFAGLAAGSKLMGGAVPLILGLFVVMDALRAPRLAWRALLARLALFGGFGLLMVGPWYARSYAFTGNPIWPFLYDTLGGRDWDPLGDEYHMQSLYNIWTADLPRTLRGFLQSFYQVYFDPASLGSYAGGLGRLLPVLAAASLILATVSRRAPRLVLELIAFCGLYYFLWFLFVSHQVRFLYPIFPALALLAAFAFYFLWDRLRRPILQSILALVLVASLLYDYPFLESNQRSTVVDRLPYLTGQADREAFLDAHIDAMPAFRYINTVLPLEAVILLLPYENRGYHLAREYIWGHPIAQRVIRFEQYDDPAPLAADLHDLGITHILDSPAWLYAGLRHWEHDRALMLSLEEQCGEQLAAWDDIVLYRLGECAG